MRAPHRAAHARSAVSRDGPRASTARGDLHTAGPGARSPCPGRRRRRCCWPPRRSRCPHLHGCAPALDLTSLMHRRVLTAAVCQATKLVRCTNGMKWGHARVAAALLQQAEQALTCACAGPAGTSPSMARPSRGECTDGFEDKLTERPSTRARRRAIRRARPCGSRARACVRSAVGHDKLLRLHGRVRAVRHEHDVLPCRHVVVQRPAPRSQHMKRVDSTPRRAAMAVINRPHRQCTGQAPRVSAGRPGLRCEEAGTCGCR
jgi:hypothetical protein